MASKAAQRRPAGRRGPLRRRRAGVRRLRLRRQHVRAARGLRGRAHRHPRVQREQQLLDRLDRAHARQAGHRGRPRRVRARRRLREDGEGRARLEVHRPRRTRSSKHAKRHERRAGLQPGAPRGADVRRRGPRVPLEVRHEARDLRPRSASKARKHAANNPYALFNQHADASRRSSRRDEVFDPLTRYQCCPPTCGAAAAVLCSDDFAKKHGHHEARCTSPRRR